MNDLFQSLRLAWRHLVRSPGFTAVAILSLALGIGANTAIFSLINAVLLRSSPLERPEELVEIYKHQADFSASPLSYPDFDDLRAAGAGVFEGVLASGYTFSQIDKPESIETLPVEQVSGNYFSLLGVNAHLGRLFTAEDEVSRAAVTVLDHGFWMKEYGGDPALIGTQIRVAGQPFVVVGVAPPSFTGNVRGLHPAMYVPIVLESYVNPSEGEPKLEQRSSHWVFTKARLAPGASLVEANTLLTTLGSSLREAGHGSWQGEDYLYAIPTQDVVMNPMIDRFIFPVSTMLLVVVGLVLMVACTNLASFLLARAASRRRDVAVRLALGASRGSLIRQLLVETMVLGLAGGALGILLAVAALRWLMNADLPLPLPITLDLSLDLRVLAFSFALSLLAGIFFGLAPALQSSRPDVVSTLKDEGTGGGRRRRFTLRNVLVTSQVAVSTVLLIGAGLFLRSLIATQGLDPGFGERPTGFLSIFTPSTEYTEVEALQFYERLRERFERLPRVVAAGLIDNPNLTPTNTQGRSINVDGVEPPAGKKAHIIDYARVDAGYFAAAGVEIVAGRPFDTRDDAAAPAVAIISQAFAERFFPHDEPLGKHLRRLEDQPSLEVVGIARDTSVRSLAESPRAFLYLPIAQDFSPYVVFLAASEGSAQQTAVSMLQAARELDPGLRVLESKTLARHLSAFLLPARASALFVGGFAALALLLAVTGLYGLVSFGVAQRAREVGIRIAIGARPMEVIRLLMAGGIRLVLLGGAVGVALAALLSRGLSGLLYGVPAADPATFIAVPLLLLAVTVVASFVPAWRASRIDPVRVMRVD